MTFPTGLAGSLSDVTCAMQFNECVCVCVCVCVCALFVALRIEEETAKHDMNQTYRFEEQSTFVTGYLEVTQLSFFC